MKTIPEIGAIIPIDEFNYVTKCDRLIVPVKGDLIATLEGRIPLDFTWGYPRVKQEWETITLERTPDGWKRIA